ncbi:MAG: dehydratase [Planctomycetes bacterium]|nr:dehydratase [Planctomycetota bacterium]
MSVSKASPLAFEDCALGASYSSPAHPITQAEIAQFAALTGDHNPVHIDPQFARRTPFRGCIAHGMLVQSLAAGLMWQSGLFEGTVVAVESVSSRFVQPVRPGDTLTARIAVAALDPDPGPRRGWVEWQVALSNQRGETCCESNWRLLMHRRRASGG